MRWILVFFVLAVGALQASEGSWEDEQQHLGMVGIRKHFVERCFVRIAIIPIFARLQV